MPTNPNRIEPTAAPATTPNPPLSESTKLVRYIPDKWKNVASLVVLVAGAAGAFFGWETVPGAVCALVVAIGAAVGIKSRGTG